VHLSKILRELHRRNVIRAGIAYVVGAWLVVQIASIFFTTFDVPDSAMQVLVIALVLGLPAALVFSWYFDITAAGIQRSEDILPQHSTGQFFDRRVDFVIIGILAASLLLSLYGNFRGTDAPPESVSILIADFKNETDSDSLSGVLEDTLRVGLEVAPFIDAFSRKSATAIAASLPGADAGSASLALEAAGLVALQRGVDIVIGGQVSRGDRGLTVSVTGLAPGSQQQLFAVTETAKSDIDILNAIATISRKLRIELGDTEIPGGSGQSESFVVANLEAAAEYLKAQDLQLDQMWIEAVVHYEKALQFDPDFARALAGLAIAEQNLGRTEAATKHWEEALTHLDTLTERGQLRTLGNYYSINQRDYEKAVDTYERLIERYPADNVAHNNLAVSAFYALDFGRALEVGREVVARLPDHSGYRANLALYAMYASRFDEASNVAQNLIKDDPGNVYAFVVLAVTHAAAGDFSAAEDTYQRMTELNQFGESIAIDGLADLAIYRGDLGAAVTILDSALEHELAQSSNHTTALRQVTRAQALLQLEERDKARNAIDIALQYSGSDPAILVPAAIALIELDDTDRAAGIAADLAESFSKSQRAYARAILAQVAHARGQTQTAIAHANSAIEAADLWLIRFIRGNIYLQSGRTAEAAADLLVCQQRMGEGMAVFLNDRPSLRYMRDLEAAMALAQAPQMAASPSL